MTRETETPCPYCGSDDYDAGSTCPRSIECPHCHAKPGSPCRRPSGHRAMTLHAGRIAAAEATDTPADELAPAPSTQLELTSEGAEPMAAWSDHEHAGEPKTAAEPVNLAGESKQAADQRQIRTVELRLAREAIAGPLGSIERARLVERIAELEHLLADEQRRPVTEAVFEKMADGRVMRQLQRDPRYRNAANAEDQAAAEEAIEREAVAELEKLYRIVD